MTPRICVEDVIKICKFIEQASKNAFIPMGFYGLLSKFASQVKPSNLIIIDGQESMIRTAFCMHVADYIACKKKIPVAIFSLGLKKEEIIKMLIAFETRIEVHRLQSGILNEDDWQRIVNAMGVLSEKAPLYLDDTLVETMEEIGDRITNLQKESKIRLVVIDYLQHIGGKGRLRSYNERVESIKIILYLKTLARKLNIPIIATSDASPSLGRDSNGRYIEKPEPSSLWEEIRKYADLAIYTSGKEIMGIYSEQEECNACLKTEE